MRQILSLQLTTSFTKTETWQKANLYQDNSDFRPESLLESTTAKPITLDDVQQMFLQRSEGFCLIGSRNKIWFKGRDYGIDLLFYNRYADRLVPVLFRPTVFRQSYQSLMSCYLQGLQQELYDHDPQPIGLILCLDDRYLETRLLMLKGKKVEELDAWSFLPTYNGLSQSFLKTLDLVQKILLEHSEGSTLQT